MTAPKIIDRIFKEPGVICELTEFEALGKPVHDSVTTRPKQKDIES